MCPKRTVLKPQLTILLNNLRTHNQRYYVVDVVQHHKISRNSEAFESSKRDLTGLRCRLEFVQGGPSALGKRYVDSKFEVAFSSYASQAS